MTAATPAPAPEVAAALAPASRRAFAARLHALDALRFGAFTLKDGSASPFYCDLRLLISDPAALRQAGEIYAALLAPLTYARIAAIPYAGLPLGAAAALAADRPLIFPRKEAKAYGAGKAIEGAYAPGETVVLLDDLVSSGLSKIEAAAPLEAAGLVVRDIVVLVDRRRGAGRGEGAGAGDGLGAYRLHAAFRLADLAADLVAAGLVAPGAAEAVAAYLAAEPEG